MPRFGNLSYRVLRKMVTLMGIAGEFRSLCESRIDPHLGYGLTHLSADERMLRELALESAFAALHLQENTAQSTSPIRIEGSHFKVGGIGWNWDGTAGAIEVLSDVTVDFQQSITPALRTVDSGKPSHLAQPRSRVSNCSCRPTRISTDSPSKIRFK